MEKKQNLSATNVGRTLWDFIAIAILPLIKKSLPLLGGLFALVFLGIILILLNDSVIKIEPGNWIEVEKTYSGTRTIENLTNIIDERILDLFEEYDSVLDQYVLNTNDIDIDIKKTNIESKILQLASVKYLEIPICYERIYKEQSIETERIRIEGIIYELNKPDM